MKLLLNTHSLLCAAGEPDKLSDEALRLTEAPESELFFIAASLWEIAIRISLGRSDFVVDARVLRRRLLDNGRSELPVVSEQAVAIVAQYAGPVRKI